MVVVTGLVDCLRLTRITTIIITTNRDTANIVETVTPMIIGVSTFENTNVKNQFFLLFSRGTSAKIRPDLKI